MRLSKLIVFVSFCDLMIISPNFQMEILILFAANLNRTNWSKVTFGIWNAA